MINRATSGILLAIILLLFTVQTAFAANDFQPVRVITSEQGYAVTDSISDAFTILMGNGVKIQHRILGTTIVMGNNIEINNDIDGDLIALGRNIVLKGKVDGNLYTASEGLTISNAVIRDAFLFASDIVLDKSSAFGRDAFLFGKNVNVFGEIKRDAVTYTENYTLHGKIGRNLSVSGENVAIADDSTIQGDFTYQSKYEALIDSNAKINGVVQQSPIVEEPVKKPSSTKYIWDILFTLGIAVAFWAFLLLAAPGLLDKFADLLASETGKAAGFGAITLAGVPIACILLLFTVIGIPLSILLGIAYAILLYLAFFVSAGAFGIVMFRQVFKQRALHKNIWYILSGVLAIKLLTMLPFVGWIFGFSSVLFGFGLVLLLLVRIRRRQLA